MKSIVLSCFPNNEEEFLILIPFLMSYRSYCPGLAWYATDAFGSPICLLLWEKLVFKDFLISSMNDACGSLESLMLYWAGPGPILSPVIAMFGMYSLAYSLNLPLKIVSLFYFSNRPPIVTSLKLYWHERGLCSLLRTLEGSCGVT